MINIPAHVYPEGVLLTFIGPGWSQIMDLPPGETDEVSMVMTNTGFCTDVEIRDKQSGKLLAKVAPTSVGMTNTMVVEGDLLVMTNTMVVEGNTHVMTDFEMRVPGNPLLTATNPLTEDPLAQDGSLEMELALLVKERQGVTWRELGHALVQHIKERGWRPLEVDEDTLSNLNKSIEYKTPEPEAYITQAEARAFVDKLETRLTDGNFQGNTFQNCTFDGGAAFVDVLNRLGSAAFVEDYPEYKDGLGLEVEQSDPKEIETADPAVEGTCGMYKLTGECYCGANCGSI